MQLQLEPLLASPVKILEVIRRRLDADYCYLARVNEEEGTISIDPEAFVIRGGRTLPNRICSSKQLVHGLIQIQLVQHVGDRRSSPDFVARRPEVVLDLDLVKRPEYFHRFHVVVVQMG